MPESYTGDEGDIALGAGLVVMDGTEKRRQGWLAINKTRDMIVTFINSFWPLSVARGGTGATNAADARNALGAQAALDYTPARQEPGSAHPVGFYTTSDSTVWFRPVPTSSAFDYRLARYSEIPSSVTTDADMVTPAAYAREAGASRFAMWMDGARFIGRSTSTRRHKSDIQPETLNVDAFLGLIVKSFIRDVDAETGERDLGLIAEDVEAAGLEDLIYRDDDGQVEGIRDHRLVYYLLAAVQRLAAERAG